MNDATEEPAPKKILKTVSLLRNAFAADAVDWVARVVLPNIERAADNARYVFPNPLAALSKFARQHSWYKHLRNSPGRFHPTLVLAGDGAATLEWRFMRLGDIYEEEFFEDGKDETEGPRNWRLLDQVPWSIMRDCFFHADHRLSVFQLRVKDERGMSEFLAKTLLSECLRLCNRITLILLSLDKNCPSEPALYFEEQELQLKKVLLPIAADDGEFGGEIGRVSINSAIYKVPFHVSIEWHAEDADDPNNYTFVPNAPFFHAD